MQKVFLLVDVSAVFCIICYIVVAYTLYEAIASPLIKLLKYLLINLILILLTVIKFTLLYIPLY